MLTLALDTATKVCTVGLVKDGKILGEYGISVGLTHSEGLIPQMDQLFSRTGLKQAEVDRIAVSIGPGSFTGLRIGLATAEAAAYAWHCGVCGVSTLKAMAYNLPAEGLILAPVLDAQKGNYYAAFYRWSEGQVQELRRTFMVSGGELLHLLADCGQSAMLLGEYDRLLRYALPQNVVPAPEQVRWPKASSVALAAKKEDTVAGEGLFSLRPYYIRRSEAEEVWDKRHA